MGTYMTFTNLFQVPLDMSVQHNIQGELRLAQAVSEALASLDITLGFLVSVGGDGDMPLVKFMVDKLHMDARTISPKVSSF